MTIQPALTPEEWANGELAYPTIAFTGPARTDHIGEQVIVWDGKNEGNSHTVTIDDHDRHALAALCLHDQSFGFTREMADAIRHLAKFCHAYFGERGNGLLRVDPTASLAEEAADRIEALLPPEDT